MTGKKMRSELQLSCEQDIALINPWSI